MLASLAVNSWMMAHPEIIRFPIAARSPDLGKSANPAVLPIRTPVLYSSRAELKKPLIRTPREPRRLSQVSEHTWSDRQRLDGLFDGLNPHQCAGDSRSDAENRIKVRTLVRCHRHRGNADIKALTCC